MDRVALAGHIIDYGLTEADLDLASGPALGLIQTQTDLHDLFPSGLAPKPTLISPPPPSDAPLPRADYLVVTWTVAELTALADVLTPGISRTSWHPYDRNFATDYLPNIRPGAPSRAAQRLASYCPTSIGDKTVLCVKSELHLNQDGIKTGEGLATLPVADFLRQIIAEVQPTLVITTGTAGATYADHDLGDVIITRAAQFRLRQEFRNEPYANSLYTSDFTVPTGMFEAAKVLLAAHADKLTEPDFAPPTTHYRLPGAEQVLPGRANHPAIRLDGRDFPALHPILTTDYFEFGTSTNDLARAGCGVEMGDAVFGMVCDELGAEAPRWLVVRNASDPQINGSLPTSPDVQAMWAVWYYDTYGYWTTVSSAIATWAVIAGDQVQPAEGPAIRT